MRVDHHACQRATTTAVTGLILEIAIATTLLVFGLVTKSTAFVFVSFYVMTGTVVWLGLIILFYQQKMQLLEALEESELAGSDPSSMFETGGDEIRPAAARLRLLHRWVMPGLSIVVAASLIVVGLILLRFLGRLDHPDDVIQTEILQTPLVGWALAVAMGFALVSFIYSRFVAGMAKVPAWANLRGGSAWMVGNSIVLVTLSVGLLFRFFENDQILIGICWGIPLFMLAVSAEIVINFVLNLYRPRMHGESPRPAFDSKTLSLFASPDSLVRSINEAINYQFGFDITSSWGYQLLLRSVAWLIGLAVLVLLCMSAMVVVEPTQQAIRIRQGEIVGQVYSPGLMFKLPWPIEVAQVVNVTRIRELHLTFKWKEERDVILWTDDYNQLAITKPNPFIVNDAQRSTVEPGSDLLSLVDVQAILRYRIAEDGLLDWLTFGSEDIDRRSRLTQREMAMLAVSQHALTNLFQDLMLDEVLTSQRGALSELASQRVQAALDAQNSGVKVLSVNLPLISPSGNAAQSFEEFSVARQGEALLVSTAEGLAHTLMTYTVGDAEMIDEVVEVVNKYNEAKDYLKTLIDNASSQDQINAAKTTLRIAELTAIELIERANGSAAAKIREARVDRWTTLMNTWVRASRVRGQMQAFKASPELYKQRLYMAVLARQLPSIRKYVIGIDPERLHLDVELRSINPLLNFQDALESDDQGGN